MIQGTNQKAAESICDYGFGNVATTRDQGYYGRGFYLLFIYLFIFYFLFFKKTFLNLNQKKKKNNKGTYLTTNPKYAAEYGKVFVIALVTIGSIFPLVVGPPGRPMKLTASISQESFELKQTEGKSRAQTLFQTPSNQNQSFPLTRTTTSPPSPSLTSISARNSTLSLDEISERNPTFTSISARNSTISSDTISERNPTLTSDTVSARSSTFTTNSTFYSTLRSKSSSTFNSNSSSTLNSGSSSTLNSNSSSTLSSTAKARNRFSFFSSKNKSKIFEPEKATQEKLMQPVELPKEMEPNYQGQSCRNGYSSHYVLSMNFLV